MLSTIQQSLILDAVDNELPPARQPELEELLAQSSEASQWYEALQEQRQQIQKLPRVAAPRSIETAVMQRITARPSQPPQKSARRHSHWLPLSIAVSTLLAIAGVTAIIVLQQSQPEADTLVKPAMVQRRTDSVDPIRAGEKSEDTPKLPHNHALNRDPQPQSELARNHPEVQTAPQPRRLTDPPLIGFKPIDEMAPLTNAPLDLPLLAPFDSLRRPAGQEQVTKKLADGTIFKLDLFTNAPGDLAKEFQSAFKKSKNPLMTETSTRRLINNRVANVPIAIYTETLRAEQITELLSNMAKQTEKKSSTLKVDQLHLYQAGMASIHELNQLLGIDLDLNANDPASHDVTSSTIHELAGAVSSNQPISIVLTYLPANQRLLQHHVADLRKFQDHRTGIKPGCKPILIILRPTQ